MELRTLKYFVAVAREESITRAAAKLFITQPALSRAIQSLEEELGKKLFERGKFSVKLTAEGFLLLRRAEEILSLVHETKIEFQMMDDILGDIYIGCAESAAMKHFARAAKSVQARHPNICFNLYSGNFEDIYFRLDKGLLDFYITLQPVDAAKYDSIILPNPDVWGIVLRKDDPLAEKNFFTLEDLRGLPLILSREGMREEYPRWFGAEFEKFKVSATFNLVFNAAIMAREGLGYLISIGDLVDTHDELCFRPLMPELKSELRFTWLKNKLLTPAAQILLREMQTLYT